MSFRKNDTSGNSSWVRRYRQSHGERVHRKQAAATKRIRIRIGTRFAARRRAWLWVFLATVTLAPTVYLLFFSGFFSVSSIAVERTALTTDVPTVQTSLASVMGRNLLFVHPAAVERKLLTDFPEMKEAEVSRLLPRTLKVTVTEYPIVARLRERTTGTEWLLSEIGQVQKKTTSLTLPVIEYRNAYQFPVPDVERQFTSLTHLRDKSIVLSREDVRTIMDARSAFEKTFTLKAGRMSLHPLERELHLVPDKGFAIWIDLDGDIPEQLSRLSVTAAGFNLFTSPFAYVDLRVKDRIIYCLHGDPCDQERDAEPRHGE